MVLNENIRRNNYEITNQRKRGPRMIERIRNWNPRGDINIKYTAGDGSKEQWSCQQSSLLRNIIDLAAEYQKMDIKLTNRQMYYQLVATDFIPNAMEVYKRVSKFITDARYGGYLDWKIFEDRGRQTRPPSEWKNIGALIDTSLKAYRLPRWKDQDFYVEVLCEKQALESVLKPVTKKWHVQFGYNKGYTSAASMYDLYQRVLAGIFDNKDVIILYFGDHDPSGIDMVRDIETRITEFLTNGELNLDPTIVNDRFSVEALALTMDQVIELNPPPNPAKISDPRAKEYIKAYGNVSWELDAIDPMLLQKIAEDGILRYLNQGKYDSVVKQEEEEAKALREFANTLDGDEDEDDEPEY